MPAFAPNADPRAQNGAQIVVFMSPDCDGCGSLVTGLDSAIRANRIDAQDARDSISFVVATYNGHESAIIDRAGEIGMVIADSGGELARACEVRGTPTLLNISMPDGIVIDYKVGGDVEWIQKALKNPHELAISKTG